jgi:hypothetical protein
MVIVCAALFLTALCNGAPAAFPAGQGGTTFAATKIRYLRSKPGGNWLYSGDISTWNSGVIDSEDFKIFDHIQSKISGPIWTEGAFQTLGVGDVIPAGTTQATATVYPYSFLSGPLIGRHPQCRGDRYLRIDWSLRLPCTYGVVVEAAGRLSADIGGAALLNALRGIVPSAIQPISILAALLPLALVGCGDPLAAFKRVPECYSVEPGPAHVAGGQIVLNACTGETWLLVQSVGRNRYNFLSVVQAGTIRLRTTFDGQEWRLRGWTRSLTA